MCVRGENWFGYETNLIWSKDKLYAVLYSILDD